MLVMLGNDVWCGHMEPSRGISLFNCLLVCECVYVCVCNNTSPARQATKLSSMGSFSITDKSH